MTEKVPWLCSQRLTLSFVAFLGFMNCYSLRVNLSVGIVCMVNHTASNQDVNDNVDFSHNNRCSGEYTNETTSIQEDGDLNWSKPTQGLVLGSFFWGYLITQLPAGWLSAKIGGKYIIGISMFICSSVSLLMPVAAMTHAAFFIALRVISGLCQGCIWSSIIALMAYWAPPLERSFLVALPFSGAYTGNVVTFPIAGLLCKHGFGGGWPSIFYVPAMTGILWSICWMYIVYDAPEKHPRIKDIERRYIQQSLSGHTSTMVNAGKIPWLHIIKSPAVWALATANVCFDWTLYTFLTNLPTYMKEVLNFRLQENTLLSCLPFLLLWFMSLLASYMADKIRSAGLLSTTAVRKIGNTLGLVLPAIFMIPLGYVDCSQKVLGVTLLMVSVGCLGFAIGAGYGVNYTDVAPKFAPILMGLANGLATIPGFVAPTIIGYITKDKTQAQWRVVFFISAAISAFGAIFYAIAGSGKIQKWAIDSKTEQEEDFIKNEKCKQDETKLS